jgi:hypothetical protein
VVEREMVSGTVSVDFWCDVLRAWERECDFLERRVSVWRPFAKVSIEQVSKKSVESMFHYFWWARPTYVLRRATRDSRMMRPMNVLSEGSSFLPPGCSFEIRLEVLKNDRGVQLPQSSRTRIHPVDDESGRRIEGASLDLGTTVGKKGPGLGFLTSLLPLLTLNMWE